MGIENISTNNKRGDSPTGWENKGSRDAYLERVRELETYDLSGSLEKAAKIEEGFTVDVGGDFEDREGYWQACCIMREFYEKGADTKKIESKINSVIYNNVAQGNMCADIFSGHYNGERDATNMIARVIL